MMMLYDLTFTTPVHFGLEGIGQERIDHTVHSDTLWGAILDKWLLLYDDDPATLCREPSFTVSSAFPLIDGIRFYPVPTGALSRVMTDVAHLETGAIPLELKDLKKIRYVAERLLFAILSGKEPLLADLTRDSVYPYPLEPKKGTGGPRLYATEAQRPRVAVDQVNDGVQEGTFFYSTDLFFNRKSGLSFFATFASREAQNRFEAALRLLGDTGLGADRSVGRGAFTFTSTQSRLPEVKNANAHLLLSLYYPTRKEVAEGVLNSPVSAYGLTRRTGHAGGVAVGRFRRADCWMVTEGSVLPFRPTGGVPRVLTASGPIPHDVYRFGRAFCLPMNRRDH